MNALLAVDPHKRPKMADLMEAVRREPRSKWELRWLAQRGASMGDTDQAHQREMEKRIKGYAPEITILCVVRSLAR